MMKTNPFFIKLVTSATLAGVLVFSTLAPTEAAPIQFTDVSKNYVEAVQYLADHNISNGMTSTKFGVGEKIIRGDAAIMLAKALEIDDINAPASGFMDVPSRGSKAINALKQLGIVNGKSVKQFGFNDLITRGEMALMLVKVNAYNLKDEAAPLKFTDVSPRYAEAVKGMVSYGITTGKTATQFGTIDSLKRGEYAIFLHRAEMQSDKYQEQGMIAKAEEAIHALPPLEQLAFSDDQAIKTARALVDSVLAVNAQAKIDNLNQLESLEKSLASWVMKKEDIEKALEFLSENEKVSLSDAEAVAAIRMSVDEILEWDKNAEIKNLTALENAEKQLGELKMNQLITQAEAAITALPKFNELTLVDEATIQSIYKLIEQIHAVDSNRVIEGITNLEEAAAKIEELKTAAEVAELIKKAETAISHLPEVADLQLSDLPKVEQARAVVNQAFAKDANATFSNLEKLVAAEVQIKKLQQAEVLKTEITKAEAAISSLPSYASLTNAHRQQVKNARTQVEVVYALDREAVIKGMDQLIAAEERLYELYKPTLSFSLGSASINNYITQLSFSFTNLNPEVLIVKKIEVFNNGISKDTFTEDRLISSGIPTSVASGKQFSISVDYGFSGRLNGSLPLYAIITITDGKRDYLYRADWK